MVKTYDEATYTRVLATVRSKVEHHPKWCDYVEEHIHKKRHLFANHIIEHYTTPTSILTTMSWLSRSIHQFFHGLGLAC